MAFVHFFIMYFPYETFYTFLIEYMSIIAYFTSLTLAKYTFKMYSLLFYDECNLLN